MSTDGFPGAIWIPAHTDRYARRESRVIEEIVLHITEGGTDKAEITAHNAFGGPKYLQGGKWMQQAAHYIVGRDGTVVQCVRHKDIAYHAGPANDWTIGIEHNTRAGKRQQGYQAHRQAVSEVGGAGPVAVQHAGLCRGQVSHIRALGSRSLRDTLELPAARAQLGPYMSAISDLQEIARGRTPMRLWNDNEI